MVLIHTKVSSIPIRRKSSTPFSRLMLSDLNGSEPRTMRTETPNANDIMARVAANQARSEGLRNESRLLKKELHSRAPFYSRFTKSDRGHSSTRCRDINEASNLGIGGQHRNAQDGERNTFELGVPQSCAWRWVASSSLVRRLEIHRIPLFSSCGSGGMDSARAYD